MYTYKLFLVPFPSQIAEINTILTHLSKTGWEPVEIYWREGSILAKTATILLD